MSASSLKCNYGLSLAEFITIVDGNITNAQLAMGSPPRYIHHLIEPNTCMTNVATRDYLNLINDGQNKKCLSHIQLAIPCLFKFIYFGFLCDNDIVPPTFHVLFVQGGAYKF